MTIEQVKAIVEAYYNASQKQIEIFEKMFPSQKSSARSDKEAFEIAIEALEKQIPKKTLWGGTNNASWRSCPECHSRENKTHKYCSQCGQKLSWESDTE